MAGFRHRLGAPAAAPARHAGAAAAERDQAARPANPELAPGYENVAGSGAYTGTDSAETTLSISQAFGGGRRARAHVAAVELALAQDAQSLQRLELAADTTRRFIAVVIAQEKLALARRQLAEQWETGEAGHGSADTADFSRVSGDLFALPPAMDDSALLAALASSPLRTSLHNSEKLRVAEIAQARARSRPPVTASLGVRAFSNKNSANTGDNALLFGISLPIPLFNNNRGAIAASVARLDAQRATNAIAQHDAELRLLALTAELKQAGAEADTLRNITLPLANEAMEQPRYGFERDRFSWLELASVQQELIDTETAAIDAAANYHTLLADLEALTGLALIVPTRKTGDTP
ncbi:MAG: TolC family protein [Pseudomonadota bacterium]